jgi:hypothetical protein
MFPSPPEITLMKIKLLAGAALGMSLAAADDSARCYAIRDPDLRNACLAVTRDGMSRCYSIQDVDARQICLARLSGDRSRCYSVRDEDLRAACLAGMWR